METIDITKFKRNRDKVFKSLVFKDNKVFTKETLFIMFPKRFIDLGLGEIEDVVTIYGVLNISNENNEYMNMVMPSKIKITPDSITEVEIGDDAYYRLTVLANDVLIEDINTVVEPDIGYETFDILLVKGVIPWYINYIDMIKIFKNVPKYTGSKIESYLDIIKIMIAVSARNYENPDEPFRMSINKVTDYNKKVFWAGLNNVYYTFNSTASKVFGSYMKAGMISAIVKPEDKPTKLENIVRS